MAGNRGLPRNEQLSMPEDLDPRTLNFIAGLWVALNGAAQAETSLMSVPERPNYYNLSGEDLERAVKELMTTGPGTAEDSLGRLAILSRVVEEFGYNLTEMLEKNNRSQ